MKVSLAVIAGNGERYIERFLDSFQPYVDEVVVVRAIGSREPDGTLDIARLRGCVTGEYRNRQDWPHVDDFAAARNAAFDLATGDWVMWADLDDILEGGERLREELEAMPAAAVALGVPYDIRDDQLRIYRERIIRRGAARWINPVHEQLDFPDGVKVGQTDRFQIVHQPTGSRAANDDRNIRILESIAEPTGSQRFHLVQSLRAVGRIEEALGHASRLVMDRPEDLGRPETFELFLLMAQLQEDPDLRGKLILQSLAVDPTRREAYGELALCSLAANDPAAAEGLSRAMLALPLPLDPPWNIRRKFYGYAGVGVLGMSLRRQGRFEEADAVETNHVIRHGARISLLHATRGRPAMAAATRRRWLETAADPDAIEHIFGLDANDPTAFSLTMHRHQAVPGTSGPVDAWNACAAVSVGEVVVQLSDDWVPPLHWDRMILEALGDTSAPKVLAISDGHRTDDLLCMAICTRARLRDQGHLFHPEFFSMFSDNWFSERAFADGVVVDARDRITFEHQHPVFGKGEMDETYARSNADYRYKTGEAIVERLRNGHRMPSEMHGWFDFRDVYDTLAQMLTTGASFVEVGVWQGKSISYLHDRLEDLGKKVDLVGVDTFLGDDDTGRRPVLDAWLENVVDRPMIDEQHCDSVEGAAHWDDHALDGVFLDAAHDYESVMADLAAWRPKVKPGGFFGGHDVDDPEVRKALVDSGVEYETMGRCWIAKG